MTILLINTSFNWAIFLSSENSQSQILIIKTQIIQIKTLILQIIDQYFIHLGINNLIYSLQFPFAQKYSTAHALINPTVSINRAISRTNCFQKMGGHPKWEAPK